jgi:hypothetical protein
MRKPSGKELAKERIIFKMLIIKPSNLINCDEKENYILLVRVILISVINLQA